MNNIWSAVWHQTRENKSILAAHSLRCAWSFLASLLLVGILSSASTQAGVIVSLLQNPTTTAGGGATSTRSGNGTWQLYAIDDSTSDFGISSYNINLSGATAINHRSPVTQIIDQNGDPQNAGFNLLRTGTNANPIQAAQSIPGQTPFLITGFGQTASNFATKAQAVDPASVVVGPTTSSSWGNYNSPFLNSAASIIGNKWVFLAEGLGSSVTITSATVAVYSNASGARVNVPTQIWDGAFPTIVIADNVNANDPGVVARDLSALYPGSPPNQFGFLNYRSPAGAVSSPALAHPATLDPVTKEFRWNSTGAMIGEYSWHTAYQDSTGNWNPHWDIIVRVTAVPEPATLTTLVFAFVSVFMFRRHSPASRRN